MYYSRQKQEKFLDEELSAISQKYINTIKTPAAALLDIGEVFVAQFIKADDNGAVILKMRNARGLPRKGDYLCCVLLTGEMCKFKNWGNISWMNLRKQFQIEFSEVYCVWQSKSDNPEFSLVGFKGMTVEMVKRLEPNCIVVLGPQDPPIAYYQNLISIVRSESQGTEVSKMLDFERTGNCWNPTVLDHVKGSADFLLNQWEFSDEVVIQGPPGTGKTSKMAELVSGLLSKGHSVLVTALTNRALMELATKDALKMFLEKGLVSKSKLTSDESKDAPKLNNISGNTLHCCKGELTLATFYISSTWAKDLETSQPFDYLVMDEASQALFAMICATKKLSKKVIWIGDQSQLPPVINMNSDVITQKDYYSLVAGFNTLCENFKYPSFILSDTFRLNERASKFTGIFYNGNLKSVSVSRNLTRLNYLNENGGPSYIPVKMPGGEKSPAAGIDAIMTVLGDLLRVDSDSMKKIAVLSKFRATIKSLQKEFVERYGNKDNVLIDTVERVQGLTCDICIFFIPNCLCYLSLDRAFFNVATSRAKEHTIIIANDDILESTGCLCSDVNTYLSSLIHDTEITTSENMSTKDTTQEDAPIKDTLNGNGLKVFGKIDLSKFERPKKELSATKTNYYLIDTNVFVTCPDIISKIDKNYSVILPAKVADELDKMKIKLDEQGKRNAEKALRLLNQESEHNIIYELADLSLLPVEFDKRSPDNMILSVALKYSADNPIILTSDNGLQIKAKTLKISTVTLRDFLKR